MTSYIILGRPGEAWYHFVTNGLHFAFQTSKNLKLSYRKFSIKSPGELINFKHSRGGLIGEGGFMNLLKIFNS